VLYHYFAVQDTDTVHTVINKLLLIQSSNQFLLIVSFVNSLIPISAMAMNNCTIVVLGVIAVFCYEVLEMTDNGVPPRPAGADNIGAADADNNNRPERNNNNIPQHPLLNVRDRLFHALFYRMATVYARAMPMPLRTAVEYSALFMVCVLFLPLSQNAKPKKIFIMLAHEKI